MCWFRLQSDFFFHLIQFNERLSLSSRAIVLVDGVNFELYVLLVCRPASTLCTTASLRSIASLRWWHLGSLVGYALAAAISGGWIIRQTRQRSIIHFSLALDVVTSLKWPRPVVDDYKHVFWHLCQVSNYECDQSCWETILRRKFIEQGRHFSAFRFRVCVCVLLFWFLAVVAFLIAVRVDMRACDCVIEMHFNFVYVLFV